MSARAAPTALTPRVPLDPLSPHLDQHVLGLVPHRLQRLGHDPRLVDRGRLGGDLDERVGRPAPVGRAQAVGLEHLDDEEALVPQVQVVQGAGHVLRHHRDLGGGGGGGGVGGAAGKKE